MERKAVEYHLFLKPFKEPKHKFLDRAVNPE